MRELYFALDLFGYGQSLPCNNFENNTSTILKNVVNAFSKEKKLPGGLWTLEEKQWK